MQDSAISTANLPTTPLTADLSIDLNIDVSGLKCPLPILRAKKALAQLVSGQTLRVITTDPHAARDFQAFAQQTGNALLSQDADGARCVHVLRRR